MRSYFTRGRALAFLVGLAHGACGGGGGGNQLGAGGSGAPAGIGGAGGGPSGQPSSDAGGSIPLSADVVQACEAYAGAICSKLIACSPAELQADFGDMSTCLTRKSLFCRAAAAAPGGMVNPATLMACAGELGGAACQAFATRNVVACQLKGIRSDGDACASDWQCGSGFCRRTRGVNCGTCTPLGRVNSPCAEATECGPGLECSDNKACAIPSVAGGPCSAAQPCQAGTYCGGNNTCAAQLAVVGAPCTERNSCAGEKGLLCSASRCASVVFAKPGQACGGEGVLLCEASADCVLGRQGNAGVCSMVARDTETCGDATGRSCLAPAECLSGVCEVPRGTDTGFCN
jgi:hypothetical protein